MRLVSIIFRTIKRYDILLLFILFYVLYNLNGRPIGNCGDTIPASLLPFSILENHNLYLDNFYLYWTNAHYLTYFVMQSKGHYLSSYPIVTPILITPIYLMPYLLLKLANYPIDLSNPGFFIIVMMLEKLTASFIAAIAGIFVFLSLKELTNGKAALIGAMVFAFATNTWTISSQALWQHGLVELLLAASVYLVLLNERRPSKMNIILLGILSGLFAFNRPAESILLAPILYYIFNLRDNRIAYYFGSAAISGGPFLLYNLYYFRDLFGGYSVLLPAFSIDSNNIISFAGLLISPNRGLFVYTPILILSIFGYFKALQIEDKNVRNFLLILGVSILIQIVIYSSFKTWWAGWSYGPRFLTGVLPALTIFLGLQIRHYLDQDILQNVHKKTTFITLCLLGILLSWSIFVQLVGAFYYPNGNWDSNPNVDLNPERIWDWNDTQIGRSLNAGIMTPYNPLNALRFVGDLRNGGRKVAFRTYSGRYICVEGGGRELAANRTSLGPWEAFILINLESNNVALCAGSGQYVSAESDGDLVANSNSLGRQETFELIDLGNNSVALLACNGKYIRVERAGNCELMVANGSAIHERETFKLFDLGSG